MILTTNFSPQAKNDLEFWLKNNLKTYAKIFQLIDNIEQSPFIGLGRPEALKHNLTGLWSRRITQEHRLIYKIENGVIIIISCKGHYICSS